MMLRLPRFLPAAFALVALGLLGAAPASAVTIYDNTVTAISGAFNPGTSEHGDEVTLSGTARTVVAFEFIYRLVSGQGDETARVRFYENDGPGGEPGTLLFDSGALAIAVSGGTFSPVLLSGLSVNVPDTFTWAVTYDGTGNTVNNQRYDPPAIGSSDDTFYWNRPLGSGWGQRSFGSIPPHANFYARIEAVPEPSTALLLVTVLGALGLGRRAPHPGPPAAD